MLHRLNVFVLSLWLALAPAAAQLAGGLQFPGPGTPHSSASYQGPGDVKAFLVWGSCARAYNAAYANGTNPLCDLVDSTAPTTVICTLRVKTNGYADTTGSYCAGLTPPAKCALLTGGVCNISQRYDQTGGGRHWTQTIAANQPTLTFGALNGLPGETHANSSTTFLATPALSQSQPFTVSAVYERTDGLSQGGVIGADSGTVICAGGLAATQTYITGGTNQAITAADNTFHSINDLFSGASSIINLNGVDSASLNAGTNFYSSNAVRSGRCDGATLTGIIMESGMINGTTSSGERGLLSTNQHSPTNGYNF